MFGVLQGTGHVVRAPESDVVGTWWVSTRLSCEVHPVPDCFVGLAHPHISSIGVDGSWAEYLRCPAQSLVKVPQGVSAEVAAVATDAVLTPWHAVTLRGAMQKGEVRSGAERKRSVCWIVV